MRGIRLIGIAALVAVGASAVAVGTAIARKPAAPAGPVFSVGLAPASGTVVAGQRPTVRGTVAFDVTRDANGAITAGTIAFSFTYHFFGAVTITGLHIHQGKRGQTGALVVDSGIGTIADPDGTGSLSATVSNVAPATLQAILGDPRSYYVELHTNGMTLRQQLVSQPPFTLPGSNTPLFTTRLSPGKEVPPVAGLLARASGGVMFQLTRDAGGTITAGTVLFKFRYEFPGAVTITGMHIHQAASGINGPIVVNSGIAALPDPDGRGTLTAVVTGVSPATLQAILDDPTGYYVNVHTAANPAGAMRGQLSAPRRP